MPFWTDLLNRIARRQGENGDTFPVSIVDGDKTVGITNDGKLKVDNSGSALPTGAATAAKQDLEIAELQAIKGKDFATQTTLAAILDKIIVAPATAAKQDSLETVLKAIRDSAGIKKIADPLPTGTNKIGKIEVDSSALPTGAATAAKQDSIITELQAIKGKDFATQTTLAAILSKIIAAPATAAKQDSLLAAIQAITAKQDSGLFANRPAANQVPAGFAYYAVDKPLGERASYSTGTAWEAM